MRRHRIIRRHFALPDFTPTPVAIADVAAAPALPYWITHGINKVYGASPAIVFEPSPPMASIRRTLRKPNKGWIKIQAMLNGEADIIRGYDDGECAPQPRGIH